MTDTHHESIPRSRGTPTTSDEIIEGYQSLSSPIVSDVLDELGRRDQVMEPGLSPVGHDGTTPTVGWAYPVRFAPAHDGSTIDAVLEMVDSIPADSVVVIAVDQDTRSALWGGLCTAGAINRGARGAVVDGAVRDYRQILDLAFPVYATTWSPRDVRDRGRLVSHGQPVRCRGVDVGQRDLVMADANGVVVVPAELVSQVLALGRERVRREHNAWRSLRKGMSAGGVYREHHVF